MRLKIFHEPVRLKKISQFFLKYFPGYQQKLYINVNFLCPCFRLIFKNCTSLIVILNEHALCAYLDLCVYLFIEKCRPCAFSLIWACAFIRDTRVCVTLFHGKEFLLSEDGFNKSILPPIFYCDLWYKKVCSYFSALIRLYIKKCR